MSRWPHSAQCVDILTVGGVGFDNAVTGSTSKESDAKSVFVHPIRINIQEL
jgi:hypothetical protein